MIGQTISHYKILEKLGEGGMGVVYKAQDLRLDRLVALKFLAPAFGGREEQKKRFVHEAKAASALDHPNICTIHEIDETVDGQMFIAMAYYQGETLKQRIERGPLPVKDAIDIVQQVAQGLAKAHSHALVHRDVKPANVILAEDGLAKIVDFGLAKLAGATELTRTGTTLGTAAYMSPEQAQGEPIDHRTDLWALGVMLYEMLAGERPFRGDHLPAIVFAIVNEKPKALESVRADVPPEVGRVAARALEKNRESRYSSAAEISNELAAWRSSLTAAPTSAVDLKLLWRQGRRPRVAVPAALVLLALAGGGGWWSYRSGKVRWAREKALPGILTLIEKGDTRAAYRLAAQAEQYIPADPLLQKLWPEMSTPVSVETNPPGADVHFKEYSDLTSDYEYLGRSPLQNVRAPQGYFRWRIARQGFVAAELAASNNIRQTLDPEGTAPPAMVRVPGGRFQSNVGSIGILGPVELAEYWIDKHEVTNRQYKEFVDRGGYQKKEYWNYPFARDGRTLAWEEAMAQFRDATGRAGPSTWEAGGYPAGQDDFPVGGVSWYEAAAFSKFAGKELPTVYHWYRAAGLFFSSYIIPLSNFGGAGPARAGTHHGLGPAGTYDMAGNVKEWCRNETGNGRAVLGGAWGEPAYMFNYLEPASPFERPAKNGFRCIKLLGGGNIPNALLGSIPRRHRDYKKERPAADDVFQVYRSLYAYEPRELNSTVESVDDSSDVWRLEKVSFNAAYGKERVSARLFLPKNSAPPFQTVIYMHGSGALQQPSSEDPSVPSRVDFVVRSGRAVLIPVYKGLWERRLEGVVHAALYTDPTAMRDLALNWVKDLGQSIDYLESRQDIDRQKLAWLGHSMGSRWGLNLIVLEGRLKLALLLDGGLPMGREMPEADQINFAPRVKIPVLMLNGRYDYIFPVEASQIPLFRLLGTPASHKRHVVLETSHGVYIARTEMIRESLDWLDRYLGPVKRSVQ